jgi:hypothetical protein
MDSYKADVLNAAFPDKDKAGRKLYVIPMMTDVKWNKADWKLYARIILGTSRVGRVRHRSLRFTGTNRTTYFKNGAGVPEWPRPKYDYFLDPDTGVETPAGTAGSKHVKFAEIENLLPARSKRVVAVYQHKYNISGRKPLSDIQYVLDAKRRLHKNIRGVKCLGVWGGSVAIIFVTRDRNRLERIRRRLHGLLGSRAKKRIR